MFKEEEGTHRNIGSYGCHEDHISRELSKYRVDSITKNEDDSAHLHF